MLLGNVFLNNGHSGTNFKAGKDNVSLNKTVTKKKQLINSNYYLQTNNSCVKNKNNDNDGFPICPETLTLNSSINQKLRKNDNEHVAFHNNRIVIKYANIQFLPDGGTWEFVNDNHGYSKKLFELYEINPFAVYKFKYKTWSWHYGGHCPRGCPWFFYAILLSQPVMTFPGKNYTGEIEATKTVNNILYIKFASTWYKVMVFFNKINGRKTAIIGDITFVFRFITLLNQGNTRFSFNYFRQYDWSERIWVLTFTSFPKALTPRKNPANFYSELALNIYNTYFETNDPYNFTQNDYASQIHLQLLHDDLNKIGKERMVKFDYIMTAGYIYVLNKEEKYEFMTNQLLWSLIPEGAKEVEFNTLIPFYIPLTVDYNYFDSTWCYDGSYITSYFFSSIKFTIN